MASSGYLLATTFSLPISFPMIHSSPLYAAAHHVQRRARLGYTHSPLFGPRVKLTQAMPCLPFTPPRLEVRSPRPCLLLLTRQYPGGLEALPPLYPWKPRSHASNASVASSQCCAPEAEVGPAPFSLPPMAFVYVSSHHTMVATLWLSLTFSTSKDGWR